MTAINHLDTSRGAATFDPELSIVIGTLNRAAMLPVVLDSLAAQSCPQERFEIIVVDNRSTDTTRQVVEERLPHTPNLRYVYESKPGLSHARNRGIAESRGSLVAFVDDDAEVDSRWAQYILSVFETERDAGAAGGPIRVRWPNVENQKPPWVPDWLTAYHGHCDYGNSRIDLRYPQYPYGSNMVIRRDLLNRVGGFNPSLGMTGRNLMAAEETDLFYRLSLGSTRVVYEPAALVHHWTTPEKLTRRWTLRRAMMHGVSSAAMRWANGDRGRRVWIGRLITAVGEALMATLATGVAWATRKQEAVVVSRCAVLMYQVGAIRGAFSNLMAPITVEEKD